MRARAGEHDVLELERVVPYVLIIVTNYTR